MATCPKCNAQVDDSAKFCTACGTTLNANSDAAKHAADAASAAAANIADSLKKFNDTTDNTAQFDSADIENNKIMGVLAYLSWLVIIPLLAASQSKFARFHTNQGLVLAIVEVIWGVVFTILTALIGGILGLIGLGFIAAIIIAVLGLVNLIFFIFSIIGIVNVVNGKAKELPIIGKISLIKY